MTNRQRQPDKDNQTKRNRQRQIDIDKRTMTKTNRQRQTDKDKQTKTNRQRQRQLDKDKLTKTNRQRQRQTDKDKQTKTNRQGQRQTDKVKQTKTNRQRQRQRDKDKDKQYPQNASPPYWASLRLDATKHHRAPNYIFFYKDNRALNVHFVYRLAKYKYHSTITSTVPAHTRVKSWLNFLYEPLPNN